MRNRVFTVLSTLIVVLFVAVGCDESTAHDLMTASVVSALRASGSYTSTDLTLSQCGPSSSLPVTRCRRLSITGCEGVADTTVMLRISDPASTPQCTDVYLSGGGGGGYYETVFGATALNNLMVPRRSNASCIIVQTSWAGSNGWLTGPGGGRALACRPATMLRAIYETIRTPGTPFCGAGNSGGNAQLTHSLAQYGVEGMLDFAVPSGGPPWGRLDEGCLGYAHKGDDNMPAWAFTCRSLAPNAQTSCILGYPGNTTTIDGMYELGTTACADARFGHATQEWLDRWRSDSVWALDADLDYGATRLHFVYGASDPGVEVPNGMTYYNVITSAKSVQVVPGVQHDVPRYAAGATAIYTAMMNNCQLYH